MEQFAENSKRTRRVANVQTVLAGLVEKPKQVTLDGVHDQLREQIPYLKRHECVERVMRATDMLLDQMLEIERVQADEDFNRVFGV